MRRSLGTAATLVGLLATAACGSAGGTDPDHADPDRTAAGAASGDTDTTVQVAVPRLCVADARPAGHSDAMPSGWPWPAGAVVYDVHRGDASGGVVATAVARGSIGSVQRALLAAVAAHGFQVTDSEAEEHDAEAEWTGQGYSGRWAMSDAPCPGQVLVQVVAAPQ